MGFLTFFSGETIPEKMKEIHNLVLKKTGNEPFGFRIIGGKDAGLSFKASIIHEYTSSLSLVGARPYPY